MPEKEFIFLSTGLESGPFIRRALPPLAVCIAGFVAYALFPVEPESGLRSPAANLVLVLGLCAGSIWWMVRHFLGRRRNVLRISSEAIRLHEGAGLLAMPGEYGRPLREVGASQIRRIERNRSATLPSRYLQRRGGGVNHIFRIEHDDGNWWLSDMQWSPTINSATALREWAGETAVRTVHGWVGLSEALRLCGYSLHERHEKP